MSLFVKIPTYIFNIWYYNMLYYTAISTEKKIDHTRLLRKVQKANKFIQPKQIRLNKIVLNDEWWDKT